MTSGEKIEVNLDSKELKAGRITHSIDLDQASVTLLRCDLVASLLGHILWVYDKDGNSINVLLDGRKIPLASTFYRPGTYTREPKVGVVAFSLEGDSPKNYVVKKCGTHQFPNIVADH